MVLETLRCINERNRSRDIHKLEHEGQTITNTKETSEIMQKWYKRAEDRVVLQIEALPDFQTRHGLDLPQLDDDKKSVLEEEFFIQEVKQAIK